MKGLYSTVITIKNAQLKQRHTPVTYITNKIQ